MRMALLASAAPVAACSPDFCSQLQTLDWSQKVGSCADAGGLPAASSCEQQLASCDSTDRSGLNGYANCLQNLPACTAAQQAEWDHAFLSCGTLLQQLSSSCPFELPGGHSVVSGTPPPTYSDGGCAENDDCVAVTCSCADVDGGTNPFQLCVNGKCDPTCPEVSCCDDLAQEPTGSFCAGPCVCASQVCNAGACE
jgi:hypothetical protein